MGEVWATTIMADATTTAESITMTALESQHQLENRTPNIYIYIAATQYDLLRIHAREDRCSMRVWDYER
jgi:hypothetical protein